MTDVLARLAAANPVPTGAPPRAPEPLRVRRVALAAGLVLAVAVPATAFAGKLGDLLGIANEGTPVSTSDVLPGQSRLDAALREMSVGATMQLLGTLNGVSFYAARNAAGLVCLATDRDRYPKGVLCDREGGTFPSATEQALTYPRMLQGVAADGVATVRFVDAGGRVLDATPVVENLFASDRRLGAGEAAAVETLDAQGNVTWRRGLP